MRLIAPLLAALAILAGCATNMPQATGNLPIHTVQAADVAGKSLTFSANDRFEIAPAPNGSMSFRDIGGPGKSGTGEWEIRDGKFWVRSGLYWRRGSEWTFYGPDADGSYRAINARDSRKTQYRVVIH